MQRLAEVEKEKEKQELPFRWEALSLLEQAVVYQLAKSQSAMPAFELYLRTCNAVYFGQEKGAVERTIIHEGILGFNSKKKEVGEYSIPLWEMKKKDALATLDKLRKQRKQIPFFPVVIRLVNNFVMLGWVNRREQTAGKEIALYYLPANVKKEILEKAKTTF
ncbi:MAG: hypothetical protein WC861_01120 [Candidatus Micrarchaeia archaeon]|jgi:hypothetical protein